MLPSLGIPPHWACSVDHAPNTTIAAHVAPPLPPTSPPPYTHTYTPPPACLNQSGGGRALSHSPSDLQKAKWVYKRDSRGRERFFVISKKENQAGLMCHSLFPLAASAASRPQAPQEYRYLSFSVDSRSHSRGYLSLRAGLRNRALQMLENSCPLRIPAMSAGKINK